MGCFGEGVCDVCACMGLGWSIAFTGFINFMNKLEKQTLTPSHFYFRENERGRMRDNAGRYRKRVSRKRSRLKRCT